MLDVVKSVAASWQASRMLASEVAVIWGQTYVDEPAMFPRRPRVPGASRLLLKAQFQLAEVLSGRGVTMMTGFSSKAYKEFPALFDVGKLVSPRRCQLCFDRVKCNVLGLVSFVGKGL